MERRSYAFHAHLLLCFTKVKQLSVRRDVLLKIKELNEGLDLIANEKDKYNNLNSGGVFVFDEAEIQGRINVEKDDLVTNLLSNSSHEGKGAIVEVLGGDKDLVQLEPLSQCIHESITGKKFLIVLDDVWTEEKNKREKIIAPLKYCARTGSIISYKMHDIVHDFAQFSTKKEYVILEVGNVSENLRSFIILSHYRRMHGFDSSQFLHLTHLQTLCLSACGLQELSRDVGRLIHLRYLDLSGNDLKEPPNTINCPLNQELKDNQLEELPVTIGGLCSLQHLDLLRCGLKKLPEDVRKLVHLEYLNLSGYEDLEGLPDTIRNLSNLQRLDLSQCRMKKLPDDVGTDETKKLGILVKGLNELRLKFRNDRDLRYLFRLELADCHNFESLPSLGRLPFLESLSIRSMKRVKMVGLDFLGVKEHRDEENGATNFVSFPRLKEHVFWMMPQWEEAQ
ncbi:putative disease resistance protein RGA3 [Morus notabilis]|uniref:putative disease resistance protein RGA3 n=1 Tax=Morus notabilis TaxID=981085 RepID=UPI000CED1181|nr:putative disease resistance protein RGA3 [Morus notabilis]